MNGHIQPEKRNNMPHPSNRADRRSSKCVHAKVEGGTNGGHIKSNHRGPRVASLCGACGLEQSTLGPSSHTSFGQHIVFQGADWRFGGSFVGSFLQEYFTSYGTAGPVSQNYFLFT